MNKKGFTLVELLGVIVILSLLTLISSIAITSIVKKSKTELTDTQKEIILKAADLWAEDNLENLTQNNYCTTKSINDLKNAGYLNNTIDVGNISVKISVESNSSTETPIINVKLNESCG